MTTERDRRTAAKVLALAIQGRHRRLIEAGLSRDENAIVMTTTDMAMVLYENVEFIIWVLKDFAGVPQTPFRPENVVKREVPLSVLPEPTNALPKTPDFLLRGAND